MSSVSRGKCSISINGVMLPDLTEAELTVKGPKPRSTICWLCGKRLYQWRTHVERIVDEHPRILHKACSEALRENPDAQGPHDDVE